MYNYFYTFGQNFINCPKALKYESLLPRGKDTLTYQNATPISRKEVNIKSRESELKISSFIILISYFIRKEHRNGFRG